MGSRQRDVRGNGMLPTEVETEIHTLQALVRKYPVKAMECLSFNEMLAYIKEHKPLGLCVMKREE